mgnify:FL=1
MEKPKVFVTHIFLKRYLKSLDEKFEVVVYPGKNITREELLEGVRGSTGIVSLLTEKIDAEVMDRAGKQLKVISNFAVGYDNIEVEAATKRGVCVTNTPGVLTESVAEQVLALIFALFRRVVEGDRMIRAHAYKGWEPDLLLGTSVKDKVLGIVGLGRIGKWTARLAKAVGMKVIYFNRTRDEEFEAENECVYHSLEKLLELSDVVSVSVALNSETKYMMAKKEFDQMKRTAIFINTARGGIVKESDLIVSLRMGKIAGAGLDVFEDESKIPEELVKMGNVVLTPHTASATVEARVAMARVLVDNLRDALEGRQPSCLVNSTVKSYE